jgi:hypothetical protein
LKEYNTRFVTVLLIKNHKIYLTGSDGARWSTTLAGAIHRCPIDEAITLVRIGTAEYPDGGIARLKEIEGGGMDLNYLSFSQKWSLISKLSIMIVTESIQSAIGFALKNRIISIPGIIAVFYSFYSAGVIQHWWPDILQPLLQKITHQ